MDFLYKEVVVNGQRTYSNLASGEWFEETEVIPYFKYFKMES